ncbi:hypothetical protein [Schaalia vaccimaxillae]|uniref:hypothetical protein n=1 Tax=Schaalia vaccimaxillae TaxID=183916 RepID=UPI00103C3BC6|nr:hypothetical protein [Schaalia vaccimaxillae]
MTMTMKQLASVVGLSERSCRRRLAEHQVRPPVEPVFVIFRQARNIFARCEDTQRILDQLESETDRAQRRRCVHELRAHSREIRWALLEFLNALNAAGKLPQDIFKVSGGVAFDGFAGIKRHDAASMAGAITGASELTKEVGA